ncbi:hypothetical protein TNIN_45681 [Trichonephila inaurata madagascariensis]|uniref:Uncharacterized protein n=1 Tax=Trichonephila inaurata madagascariensis TaxID=2747483 RepID=A0A8X7CSZ5_9ARAC|nr:hypothetical protein TNIN_45681 [Trichonephila inaurata madagascariensis]
MTKILISFLIEEKKYTDRACLMKLIFCDIAFNQKTADVPKSYKSISGSPDNLRQLNPQSVSQRRQPTEILIHSTDRTRAFTLPKQPTKNSSFIDISSDAIPQI